MTSIPVEWLEKLRAKAKEMGLDTEYWVLDTILRMWSAQHFEVPDE